MINKCPRTGCNNEAIYDEHYGLLPCINCQRQDASGTAIKPKPDFYTLSRQARITVQRDKHAKDLLQPWEGRQPNPKFVKTYGIDTAKNYIPMEKLNQLWPQLSLPRKNIL